MADPPAGSEWSLGRPVRPRLSDWPWMTPIGPLVPADRERFEQAALWRQTVLPRMRAVLAELRELRDSCGDPSLERLQLARAIDSTAWAINTCAADLEIALDRLDQLGEKPCEPDE